MFKGIRKYSQEFELYPDFSATIIRLKELQIRLNLEKGSVSLYKSIYMKTETSYGTEPVLKEEECRLNKVTQ